MRVFYCDHFVLPLPAGHRFPMEKYALLRERVVAHGEDDLIAPDAATDVPIALVMSGGYAHDVRDTVEIHFASVRAASLWLSAGSPA